MTRLVWFKAVFPVRNKALLIWWFYHLLRFQDVFPVFSFLCWNALCPFEWKNNLLAISCLLFCIISLTLPLKHPHFHKVVSIEHHFCDIGIILNVGPLPEFILKLFCRLLDRHTGMWASFPLFQFFSLSHFFSFFRPRPGALSRAWKLPAAKISLGWCHVNIYSAANIHRHLHTRSFHHPEEPLMPRSSELRIAFVSWNSFLFHISASVHWFFWGEKAPWYLSNTKHLITLWLYLSRDYRNCATVMVGKIMWMSQWHHIKSG